METRILFHLEVAAALPDINVGTGTPTSTIDLTGSIDNEDLTGTIVRLATSNGNLDLHLFDSVKPVTVANFLNYVNSGAYSQTLVHRSADLNDAGVVVIQGGGYFAPTTTVGTPFAHIPTNAPINNEFTNNGVISNLRGTIAFAKSSNPNSATSEWFINMIDNTDLDNPVNSGGFTVFGEVINGTLANADQIEQLPKFNLGGALSQTPLNNYTQADFDNAVPRTDANFVINTTAAVLPEVTFSASSSNPSLVTAAVVNNALTLTYVDGAEGTADITVTGTGTDGTQVTDTFAVNVGALVVTVGDGAAKQVTFTDADGTVGTVSLKGGTAAVTFAGDGLTQTTTSRGVTVTGAVGALESIVMTGSNSASTLNVKTKGGNGVIEINDITGAGGVKTLAGKGLSVNGAVNVGSAAKIDLADITSGSLTVGGATPVALSIPGGADDTNITTAGPIKSAKLGRFGGSDGVAQALTAPSISNLTVTNDFAGNLIVSGAANTVKVGGTATAGTWTVGTLGKATVGGELTSDLVITSLSSLKAGSITSANIFSSATIGKIASGNVTDSQIYAAITGNTFPDTADDFAAGGAISGVTIKGVFTNSAIAASTLGKMNLGTVALANNTNAFGLAGSSIASVAARDAAGAALKLSRLTEPSQSFEREDFDIRVF